MPARGAKSPRSSQVRGDGTNVLLHLGWPHFWLFSSILGGIVALVALALLAHQVSL